MQVPAGYGWYLLRLEHLVRPQQARMKHARLFAVPPNMSLLGVEHLECKSIVPAQGNPSTVAVN
jgi:hypothetical protein